MLPPASRNLTAPPLPPGSTSATYRTFWPTTADKVEADRVMAVPTGRLAELNSVAPGAGRADNGADPGPLVGPELPVAAPAAPTLEDPGGWNCGLAMWLGDADTSGPATVVPVVGLRPEGEPTPKAAASPAPEATTAADAATEATEAARRLSWSRRCASRLERRFW